MNSELPTSADALLAERARLEEVLQSSEDWCELLRLKSRKDRGEGMSAVNAARLEMVLIDALAEDPDFIRYKAVCVALERLIRGLPPLPPKGSSATVPQDNLTEIHGITASMARRLNALDVTTFMQIAEWTPADVRSISSDLGIGRQIFEQDWIGQAEELATRVDPAPEPLPKATQTSSARPTAVGNSAVTRQPVHTAPVSRPEPKPVAPPVKTPDADAGHRPRQQDVAAISDKPASIEPMMSPPAAAEPIDRRSVQPAPAPPSQKSPLPALPKDVAPPPAPVVASPPAASPRVETVSETVVSGKVTPEPVTVAPVAAAPVPVVPPPAKDAVQAPPSIVSNTAAAPQTSVSSAAAAAPPSPPSAASTPTAPTSAKSFAEALAGSRVATGEKSAGVTAKSEAAVSPSDTVSLQSAPPPRPMKPAVYQDGPPEPVMAGAPLATVAQSSPSEPARPNVQVSTASGGVPSVASSSAVKDQVVRPLVEAAKLIGPVPRPLVITRASLPQPEPKIEPKPAPVAEPKIAVAAETKPVQAPTPAAAPQGDLKPALRLDNEARAVPPPRPPMAPSNLQPSSPAPSRPAAPSMSISEAIAYAAEVARQAPKSPQAKPSPPVVSHSASDRPEARRDQAPSASGAFAALGDGSSAKINADAQKPMKPPLATPTNKAPVVPPPLPEGFLPPVLDDGGDDAPFGWSGRGPAGRGSERDDPSQLRSNVEEATVEIVVKSAPEAVPSPRVALSKVVAETKTTAAEAPRPVTPIGRFLKALTGN